MSDSNPPTRRSRLMTEYGMILVLLLLVVSFSILTVTDIQNSGATAGRELAESIQVMPAGRRVAIFTPQNVTGVQLATALRDDLMSGEIVGTVHGSPPRSARPWASGVRRRTASTSSPARTQSPSGR